MPEKERHVSKKEKPKPKIESKKIILNENDLTSIRKMLKRTKHNLIFIVLLLLITMLFLLYLDISEADKICIEKDIAKKEISTLIFNEAGLKPIKHYFKNIKKNNIGIKKLWVNKNKYYFSSILLVDVLKDIQVDLYAKSATDLKTVQEKNKKLLSIIQEYETLDPFDGLEPVQKDSFENLQIKLKDNYPLVRIEIDKIANELKNKNNLVEKYLASSDISMWFSIVSLAFALIMVVFDVIKKNIIKKGMKNII